ncbi:unnamed protein product, partial [marine sediment metagenome]
MGRRKESKIYSDLEKTNKEIILEILEESNKPTKEDEENFGITDTIQEIVE